MAEATLENTGQEGERLARASIEAGLRLPLVGGCAIRLRCPSAARPGLAREYGDVDVIGRGEDRKEITAFMEAQGYEADKMFNALHGAVRLNFHDSARGRPVDVLLDRFRMAHEIDLRRALEGEPQLTLPLADLLLTKFQVVSLNLKDLKDIIALLVDHDLGAGPEEIAIERVLEATEGDWGLEHTIRGTAAKVRERLAEFELPPEDADSVMGRLDRLEQALEAAPKSRRWKMRARIGERKRWYEEPEEAR